MIQILKDRLFMCGQMLSIAHGDEEVGNAIRQYNLALAALSAAEERNKA